MYVFLSEEWIIAAREVRERYADLIPEITQVIRVNQVITEVPFDEGTLNVYIDTSEGSVAVELGELDEPDAVMMTDYETAKAVLVGRDPALVMQAFLEGRIRVQGDMMKLMAMQASMPRNEHSESLADDILAITDE